MCAVNFKQLWSDTLPLASVVAKSSKISIYFLIKRLTAIKSATARQIQPNDTCAQQRLRSALASAKSDKSLCCPHEETLGLSLPIKRTAKTLIRLCRCPGWSESSLGAQVILLVSHVAAQMTSLSRFLKVWGRSLKKSSPATIFICIWAGTRNGLFIYLIFYYYYLRFYVPVNNYGHVETVS